MVLVTDVVTSVELMLTGALASNFFKSNNLSMSEVSVDVQYVFSQEDGARPLLNTVRTMTSADTNAVGTTARMSMKIVKSFMVMLMDVVSRKNVCSDLRFL